MKFRVFTYDYGTTSGGVMVLYKLANDLITLGHEVKLFDAHNKQIKNPLCSNYSQTYASEDEIVIYPEVVVGNPLKAIRVIRWILCDLGKNCSSDIYKSWSKSDVVYHYSSYNSSVSNKEIRSLFTMTLDTCFYNKQLPRNGSCFTIRKASKFHKNISLLHPVGSKEITDESHEDLVTIFNSCEYFYCYDPYTYLAFMAAACGCIPIVIPMKTVTKLAWLKTLFCANYMDEKNIMDMDGIAYGIDNIDFAKATIHNTRQQQDDIINYGFETVKRMITDMESIKDSSSIKWNVGNIFHKLKFVVLVPGYKELPAYTLFYRIAEELLTLGQTVSLFDFTYANIPNRFCTNYIRRHAEDDEIVIYPEMLSGNTLNAKRIVRWILSHRLSHNICKTWLSTDFAYTNEPSSNPENRHLTVGDGSIARFIEDMKTIEDASKISWNAQNYYNKSHIHTSAHRPNVITFDTRSFQTFLEFLLSDESPERQHPCILYWFDNYEIREPIILYNCEQMSRDQQPETIAKLASNPNVKEVWDYSLENCRILKTYGIEARHVPLVSPRAYVEQIQSLRNDITVDVGFCGALSERRLMILNELMREGLTVHCVTDHGIERDKRLARCRVILNIHHSDDYAIFEQARCDVWLRVGVPVVSESSLDDDPRCINTPYKSLVKAVMSVIQRR